MLDRLRGNAETASREEDRSNQSGYTVPETRPDRSTAYAIESVEGDLRKRLAAYYGTRNFVAIEAYDGRSLVLSSAHDVRVSAPGTVSFTDANGTPAMEIDPVNGWLGLCKYRKVHPQKSEIPEGAAAVYLYDLRSQDSRVDKMRPRRIALFIAFHHPSGEFAIQQIGIL